MVRKYGLHILGYMLKNGWDEGYLKKESSSSQHTINQISSEIIIQI